MLAALLLVALPILPQGWYGTLDPWSKGSPDGTRVLTVDPEQRGGLGSARTSLHDASGREIWSRMLEYSLRDAEVTEKGEVIGWAVRTEPPGPRNQLGLVILDPEGKGRSVDWLVDSAGYFVVGIVIVSGADRAIVRLDRIRGDVFTGREREEWLTVRISTGEHLARFTPPVLQREGWAGLRRVVAVRATPLLCCEAWFGSSGEALVELLNFEGQQIWSVALQEARPHGREYLDWMRSVDRLSSTAQGEFAFQRIGPDEHVRWRVDERSEAPGTWIVTELAREARPLHLESAPSATAPRSFTPRILSERRLVALTAGQPCTTGAWSDAAIDAQGRLLVLEAENAHLQRFDAQGEFIDTIELRGAGKHVNRILGSSRDRFDLSVGDSFATWDAKGERLSEAYDRWHHALAQPASHAVGGARWFIDANEVLGHAEDDPQAAVTTRIARHPDRTWFGELDGGAVAQDASLVTVDHAETYGMTMGTGESTVSRYDGQGHGKDQFRARLVSTRFLRARGRWLAGNDSGSAACFLADLDAKQVYGLSGEFNSWSFRALLPPAEGEFWIIDLVGKRLLRAALPEK